MNRTGPALMERGHPSNLDSPPSSRRLRRSGRRRTHQFSLTRTRLEAVIDQRGRSARLVFKCANNSGRAFGL